MSPIASRTSFPLARVLPAAAACTALLTLGHATPGAAATADDALTEVIVIGSRERLRALPGAGSVIDGEELTRSHPFTVNEALRKVPGVFARDEEGLGLRPNIGIRGLNPTRSTKVLLLEDGLPLAYGPYGDNASYYHPPLDRFERIEVLKGASQVLFGPQTVGGVINYITKAAPEDLSGELRLGGGSRGYRDFRGSLGNTLGDASGDGDRSTGFLLGASLLESDGARDNVHSRLRDVNFKLTQSLGEAQALTVRASSYAERSQVTYSGLTLEEWRADPRANVFADDAMDLDRWGLSATHAWKLAPHRELRTSAYYSYLNRDWWRQSSNSGQRPNDASDPACGSLANLHTTCGNEGRLRQYYTTGIESRLVTPLPLGGLANETEVGVRAHFEYQYRVQVNGDSPDARDAGTGPNAGIREDNERRVDAYSAFWQTRVALGPLALTPGARYEHVRFARDNRLTAARGETTLTQFIPGLGATYSLAPSWTLFAGAHRGFSPPRVEDVVGPNGGVVDLDAELSWNYELGVRAQPRPALAFELTAFRMDFENQIVPASLAGGVGATLTSAGRTLHQGIEFASTIDPLALGRSSWRVFARTALTWLRDAQYVGTRFSSVGGFDSVSIAGNRLPYAPEWLGTVSVGVDAPRGLRAQLEAVHTGAMFGDDLNSIPITANGQRGRLPGYTTLNLAVEQRLSDGVTMYVTVKNLADELYIADLSRGILPGTPRLVQAGLDWKF